MSKIMVYMTLILLASSFTQATVSNLDSVVTQNTVETESLDTLDYNLTNENFKSYTNNSDSDLNEPYYLQGLFDELFRDNFGHRSRRDHARRNRGNDRNTTCIARDRGWEEHGEHRSCRQCLRHHGTCIKVCSRTQYVCEASPNGSIRGPSYQGEGRNLRRAKRRALRACERRHLNQFCSIDTCEDESRVVSRNRCRGRR